MNWERAILISFLGNYVTNNVVAGVVALLPASATGGVLTPQYISYVVLAAIVVGVLTWWYGARGLQAGAIFGLAGFVVAIVTSFITGITGVLTQTGSFSQMIGVIPNFWPFLASWSTLVLLAYWVIPAALIGWWKSRPAASPMM